MRLLLRIFVPLPLKASSFIHLDLGASFPPPEISGNEYFQSATSLRRGVSLLGSPEWSHELDSMIPAGPFQPRIFCDCVLHPSTGKREIEHKVGNKAQEDRTTVSWHPWDEHGRCAVDVQWIGG